MTSHVAVKDHMVFRGAWLECKMKLLKKSGRNDSEKCLQTSAWLYGIVKKEKMLNISCVKLK